MIEQNYGVPIQPAFRDAHAGLGGVVFVSAVRVTRKGVATVLFESLFGQEMPL